MVGAVDLQEVKEVADLYEDPQEMTVANLSVCVDHSAVCGPMAALWEYFMQPLNMT